MKELIIYCKDLIFSNLDYKIVFFVMFLESLPLPPIIPTELFLIFLGFFLFQNDNLSIFYIFLIANLGIVFASSVNYLLGNLLGRNFIIRNLRYFCVSQERFEKYEHYIKKNWKLFLFLGRWLPIPGVKHFISIPCGFMGVNLRYFFLITIVGGTTLMSFYIPLGYFFGTAVGDFIFRYLKNGTISIVIVVIVYKMSIGKLNKLKRKIFKLD